MKYSPKFFRDNLPAWKRKKDPLVLKIFFRPCSFLVSSLCANLNISANHVSVFSSFVAVLACVFLFINNRVLNICGGILTAVWLLLDCVDGNLARCVKKQPYGDFVDAMSSYLLVGLVGVCAGYRVYTDGGILTESGQVIFIVLGALGSSADSLMRLIYQKYMNATFELQSMGIVENKKEKRTTEEAAGSLQIRLEQEFGIAGFLNPLILVCSVTKTFDIVVMYMFFYFGLASIIMIAKYVLKASKYFNVPFEK